MKPDKPFLARSLFLMFRFELMLLMSSITLPLYLGGFLCFLSVMVFLIGDFLNSNLATLDLQWQFLPWISIIFIPAFSINAFNRQIHSGSQDLELSYPLPEIIIILGKWLSGLAIFIVMLLLTVPLVLTLEFLGNPDRGVMLAGYFGAFIMLCLFYSIALYAAAITRDQIGGFLIGSGFIFLLILADLQFLQSASVPKELQTLAGHFYLASPKHWLDEITSGRIDLAAISYFFIFTFFVIVLTTLQVKTFRNPPKKALFSTFASILGLFATCCVSSYVSSVLSEQSIFFDTTEYREFRLQPETLNLAKRSSEPIEVIFYQSEDISIVPRAIRQHMSRVSGTLKILSQTSNGNLNFSTVKLSPDTAEADKAGILGVRSIPMTSGDSLFFGALFKSGNRSLVIDYFDIRRAGILEYEIALKISNLSKKITPKVSVISSLFKPTNIHDAHPYISIIDELKTQYDVEILPYFSDTLTKTDLLIVIDTPILKREMLNSIDRHITAGKPTLILLDPYHRMNRRNANLKRSQSNMGEINSLEDLLTSYGIKFSTENIVGDLENAAAVETQGGRQYLYPYWLRLDSNNLSVSSPVTANLGQVYFPEAGFVSIDNSDPIFEPLIFTGKTPGLINRANFTNKDTEYLAKTFASTESKPLNISTYVTGKIRSPFRENIFTDNAALILVADVDWIYDIFSQSGSDISSAANDNVPLFMNMVEYLAGNPNLLTIRSKGNPIRPFTVVEELLLRGQKKYQSLEIQYLEKLRESEIIISEVLSMAGVNTIEELPDELAKQATEFKANSFPLKQELRQIRRSMRTEIDNLFIKITVINLVAGPFLASLFYILAYRLRFFRYQK